jgi:hypothetical protein
VINRQKDLLSLHHKGFAADFKAKDNQVAAVNMKQAKADDEWDEGHVYEHGPEVAVFAAFWGITMHTSIVRCSCKHAICNLQFAICNLK